MQTFLGSIMVTYNLFNIIKSLENQSFNIGSIINCLTLNTVHLSTSLFNVLISAFTHLLPQLVSSYLAGGLNIGPILPLTSLSSFKFK